MSISAKFKKQFTGQAKPAREKIVRAKAIGKSASGKSAASKFAVSQSASQQGCDTELLDAMNVLQKEINFAQKNLDYATDTVLIDGYIYELISLNKKYEYCVQLARGEQA